MSYATTISERKITNIIILYLYTFLLLGYALIWFIRPNCTSITGKHGKDITIITGIISIESDTENLRRLENIQPGKASIISGKCLINITARALRGQSHMTDTYAL